MNIYDGRIITIIKKELNYLIANNLISIVKHINHDLFIVISTPKNGSYEDEILKEKYLGLIYDKNYKIIEKFSNKYNTYNGENIHIIDKFEFFEGITILLFIHEDEWIISWEKGFFTLDYLKHFNIHIPNYEKLYDYYEYSFIFKIRYVDNNIIGELEKNRVILYSLKRKGEFINYENMQYFTNLFEIIQRASITYDGVFLCISDDGFYLDSNNNGYRYILNNRIISNIDLWKLMRDDDEILNVLMGFSSRVRKNILFFRKKMRIKYKMNELNSFKKFYANKMKSDIDIPYSDKHFPVVLKMMNNMKYDDELWGILKPKRYEIIIQYVT